MDHQDICNGGPATVLRTPVLAIKHAICFTCLQSFPNLKKSMACKRVSYCSPECQKIDWQKAHKKTCKMLVQSNKRRAETPRTSRSWKQCLSEKWLDIAAFKAQNSEFTETQLRLLVYEPFCRHCYRSKPQMESKNQPSPCQACHIAAFCADCPQEHATSECKTFQAIRQDETFAIQHHRMTQRDFEVLCTERPRKAYLPLSTATGWHDYFTRISDKEAYLSDVTSEMQPATDDPTAVKLAGLMRLASGTSSMALTVLAALEAVFPDISTRTTIKLHFIGAAYPEFDGLRVFEELLHLLPSLKNLELTLVGFEMPERSTEDIMELKCCPTCTAASRTRSLRLWKGAYHDYLKRDGYEKPDLAVAFHTGFSQSMEEEWLPTVQYLAAAPHPTLFTSYNEKEMEEETAILDRFVLAPI
ncbi:putative mitochondrial protein MSS51-like protein [Lachnellula arida]|uniref:Putative mitochondrial protein MSS51-like protein n=1 Tax=Lachnellula arida TaxID=1316785 RepID=A0A8T9BA84_9HELO|nr:putative mitochondrial protein MSS51-like protein [Lachnellula arida]